MRVQILEQDRGVVLAVVIDDTDTAVAYEVRGECGRVESFETQSDATDVYEAMVQS